MMFLKCLKNVEVNKFGQNFNCSLSAAFIDMINDLINANINFEISESIAWLYDHYYLSLFFFQS